MRALAVDPLTGTVTTGAVDPTGVAVTVEEVIRALAVGSGDQETRNDPFHSRCKEGSYSEG